MSLINKFKSLLPISSRSFHAAEKHFVTQNDLVKDELFDIKSKQDELFRRIEQADNGINENLNAKYDAIDASLRTEAERNKLRMEALFRKAYPNDTPAETRRRIFSLLPEAEGNARIMQKANGRLMFELDALCKKANLPYWTSFGSLIGALSRNGFIPWDDDIDICMMREDVDKLKEICANNPDFQLTLVYDGYVFCRQVRFSSATSTSPASLTSVYGTGPPPLAKARMTPFVLYELSSWMLSWRK